MPSRATSTRSSSGPARGASRARGSASRSREASGSALEIPARRRLDARRARAGAPRRVPGHRRAAPRGVRPRAARRRARRPRASSRDALCVGSGAVRYRATLERLGARRASRRRRAARSARPASRVARARVRAGGCDSADLRPRARRQGHELARMNVELRRLEPRDLDTVEEIERASYPTPWSRSMFVAELRKPSSLAIGAYSRGGRASSATRSSRATSTPGTS